ncbi:MAG: ABC transporter permease [Erysipelotrichaceae bacterium]
MNFNMVLDHMFIVFIALVFTVLVGVPLGILIYFYPKTKKVILKIVDIFQTVPALALLGIIMIFLGAGKPTVVTGLVLYSLLPVVNNTYLGLASVNEGVKDAAKGMGMSAFQRLIKVELPIAFPLIFTGLRIAIITSIGTAVFAAYVGGGGLGEVIRNAIRVSNMELILQSTLVLMAMAIGLDLILGFIESKLNKKTT